MAESRVERPEQGGSEREKSTNDDESVENLMLVRGSGDDLVMMESDDGREDDEHASVRGESVGPGPDGIEGQSHGQSVRGGLSFVEGEDAARMSVPSQHSKKDMDRTMRRSADREVVSAAGELLLKVREGSRSRASRTSRTSQAARGTDVTRDGSGCVAGSVDSLPLPSRYSVAAVAVQRTDPLQTRKNE